MGGAWVKVAVATAVLGALAPAVRADVPRALPAAEPPLLVTGHERTLGDYLRSGHSPRRAAVLRQLDHLASQGVDAHLLTVAAASADTTPSSAPQVSVALTSAGSLDGGPGRDVLELRAISGSTGTTQLVARDGATGRVLWQRTSRSAKGTFMSPVPALVGSPARAGVLLATFSFEDDEIGFEALDGRGRSLWRRAVRVQPLESGGSATGYEFAFSFTATTFDVDVPLRRGAPELLLTIERGVASSDGVRTTYRGDLTYHALRVADGGPRVVSRTASSDGWVLGGTAGDQDGDRLTDLTVAVSGAKPRLAVLRGSDGAVVWDRTDLATNGFAWMTPARAWDSTAPGTPDLAVLIGPDDGIIGPVEVPWVPEDPSGVTGRTIADPTAAEHGTVMLLARRTGSTLWSRPGDDIFLMDGTGASQVGVVTDTSSGSGSTYSARARLELVTRAGTVRWTREHSYTVPTDPDETPEAYVSAYGMTDLDGDGGQEVNLVLMVLSSSSFDSQEILVRSSDGARLKDQRSDLLFGGVTRRGTDRYRTGASGRALSLSVLRGRDSKVLFTRLLPGSSGVPSGSVSAVPLGRAPCGDLLFAGAGSSRSDLVVLASDGTPRWWVSAVANDLRPRDATRATRQPLARC